MAKVRHVPGPDSKRLEAALSQLDGLAARAGWFEDNKYPDGTPVAYIAAIHEAGYAPKNIPARMGLQSTMIPDQQEYWAKVAEVGAKKVLAGEMSVAEALDLLGGVVEGAIRKQIASVQLPELKASTKANRARRLGIPVEALTGTGSKPLIEPVMSKKNGGGSGGLLQATVTHTVGPKGGDE